MIGGSLRTMEAIRDQRFPQIRHGEQRNPTVYGSREANRNLSSKLTGKSGA